MPSPVASCASCGATPSSLLRCSRCKWVGYCSEDCQRRHWTHGGHRALCATLRRVAAFRQCEQRFWTSRPQGELARFADEQGGLDPASMCFYGEVLFVLSGLKPCLFFSNLPVSWRRPFTEEVVFASGILDHSSAECSPLLRVVAADVRTPAEYSLSSTLVLVNTNHPACSTIDETLHLLPVPMPLVGDLPSCDRSVHTVEEPTLARLLDYPVALDECVDPMIEVGYFAVASDGTRQLLLSYCASAIAGHAARIRSHFARYQQAFDPATLVLALETTRLS